MDRNRRGVDSKLAWGTRMETTLPGCPNPLISFVGLVEGIASRSNDACCKISSAAKPQGVDRIWGRLGCDERVVTLGL